MASFLLFRIQNVTESMTNSRFAQPVLSHWIWICVAPFKNHQKKYHRILVMFKIHETTVIAPHIIGRTAFRNNVFRSFNETNGTTTIIEWIVNGSHCRMRLNRNVITSYPRWWCLNCQSVAESIHLFQQFGSDLLEQHTAHGCWW